MKPYLTIFLIAMSSCSEKIKHVADDSSHRATIEPEALSPKANPHALSLTILKINGRLEAKLTNNSSIDLGIALGQDFLRLKPGENETLLIPVRKKIKIYQFKNGSNKFKALIAGMVSPKESQTQFPIPQLTTKL